LEARERGSNRRQKESAKYELQNMYIALHKHKIKEDKTVVACRRRKEMENAHMTSRKS
jgi:hypothetical protein